MQEPVNDNELCPLQNNLINVAHTFRVRTYL